MEAVRLRWIVLLLIFLSAGVVCADEPAVPQLPKIAAQATPARDEWERCLARSVRRELRSKRTPDDIAARALSMCTREQKRLQAVLARGIGKQRAETVITEVRRMQRDGLVLVVEELRRR
jgi:hypothetical protein